MSEWYRVLKGDDYFPDWADGGRPVEAEAGGTVTTGRLIIADFSTLDDGDEVPIFSVEDGSGNGVSLFEFTRYRFTD